jgi:hypothetical protein
MLIACRARTATSITEATARWRALGDLPPPFPSLDNAAAGLLVSLEEDFDALLAEPDYQKFMEPGHGCGARSVLMGERPEDTMAALVAACQALAGSSSGHR